MTFSVLVVYASQIGYGRFEGSGEGSGALDNLSLFGELSLIPTAFLVVPLLPVALRIRQIADVRPWDRVFHLGLVDRFRRS